MQSDSSPVDGEIVEDAATGGAPPPLDDDDDVADAEIVEAPGLIPPPVLGVSAYGSLQAPDYTDAGVPSLDYVRDKIEGRQATALGSVELAEAAAAREAALRAAAGGRAVRTADELRAAREQAAKDKLDEIRRSLHP